MKTTYRTAIHDAIRDALREDPRVLLMGEDVGRYGGTYAVSKELLEEFGPERVRDTPLSELGFVGIGIGAALGGLRPIVEVMTVNFSLLALDQIVNTAAALRHMSGGQFSVPLVVLAMSHGAIPCTEGPLGRWLQFALATPVVLGPGRPFACVKSSDMALTTALLSGTSQ